MMDLIDREQAIEKMKAATNDWLEGHRTDSYWKGFSMGTHITIQTIYHDVPSAEKTGRWIDKGSLSCRCSECGCKSPKEYTYCPNCGKRMEK